MFCLKRVDYNMLLIIRIKRISDSYKIQIFIYVIYIYKYLSYLLNYWFTVYIYMIKDKVRY